MTATTLSAPYQARPASPVLGAEVTGVDLATWHYAVNDYDAPRACRKVIEG